MVARIEVSSKIGDARAEVRKRKIKSMGIDIENVELVDVYTVDATLNRNDLLGVADMLSNPVTQNVSINHPWTPESFDHAVRDAILAGEKEIRASTHIITEEVDNGPVLMVSQSFKIRHPVSSESLDAQAAVYQTLLKEKGDWEIFPKTLEYVADGRFAHEAGRLYFDGERIPEGVRL